MSTDSIKYINMFKYVHINWIKLFKPYKEQLDIILHTLKDCEITPPLDDIFNTFIFNPLDTIVIILGQDPYPTKGYANGLSFSSNSSKTPKSLQNIFKHINTLGYTTDSNDLSSWLRQGVLLLNTSLTTIVGTTKSHTNLWLNFIRSIITDLSNLVTTHKIHFLLWGNDAHSFESCIKNNHIIKKFSHPSPLTGICFKPPEKHFTRRINWSTTNDPIIIYTDGADELYGKSSFGVYIPNILTCTGLVDPHKFELEYDKMNLPVIEPKIDTEIPPTSQRAEYLAMCYALWIIIKLKLKNVVIVTDSYNTRGLIIEWEEHRKTKNKDLVRIMNELYNVSFRPQIEHIRSHNKEPDLEKKKIYGDGNTFVDKLAVKTLKTKTDYNLYIHYYKVNYGL